MTLLSIPRNDWDAMTAIQQVGFSTQSHITLGHPVVMVNDVGQEFVCWDDDRFNLDDIATLSVLTDDPTLIPTSEDEA